jgi:hypothetical protein
LSDQIQHHLLQDRWIIREILGVDSHVSKFFIKCTHLLTT